MSEKISYREYSRRRGVSAQAVSKAVKTGRISAHTDKKGKKYINPAEADVQWEQNTDKASQRKKLSPVAAETEVDTSEKLQGPSYARSRAIREAYQAKIAKITYEEMAGKLVDAGLVKLEAYNIAKTVRESLLAIPDRLAAILAAEADEHQVHVLLTDEINKALEELARARRR